MLGSANLGPLDICEKLIGLRRNYSAAGSPVSMKFGRLMQNNIPILKIWSIKTGSRIPI